MAKTETERTPAQKLARQVYDQVKSGTIARNINLDLSELALNLIHTKDKNFVIINDGTVQYFIDKTNSQMIDEVRRIMNYKQRVSTEEWKNAEAAIDQLNELTQ